MNKTLESQQNKSVASWLPSIGPTLLFIAACAYGMLEVHSSTDTWIGLAAGRQIAELGHVPKTDNFSFTFPGQPWYNQNWGTHLAQYWMYSKFGPNAVIYATWALVAASALMIVLACWKRTASLPAALIAASIAVLGFRDYVSARPATTGFFCMAALSAILCSVESPWQKNRWLPIAVIPILLLVWGCVHGSFTFGYGVLGLYVICWLISRPIKPSLYLAEEKHVAGIVVGVAIALVLTLLLGPFGIENFTHGEKVASSKTFRGVSEWHSPVPECPSCERFSFPNLERCTWCGVPIQQLPFPPVWRFWLILSVSLFAVLGAFGVRAISAGFSTELEKKKAPPAAKLHLNFFDFLPLLIGLGMTFWARRFGPIFYIFGAPIILTLVLRSIGSASSIFKKSAGIAFIAIASLTAAVLVGGETIKKGLTEISGQLEQSPGSNLLQRVTHYTQSPTDSIEYLKRNELSPNLLIEWTQAGIAMFDWPNSKVFMDGRAQQVYEESTYVKYVQIVAEYNMYPSEAQAREAALASLESAGDAAKSASPRPRVDAVLLRMGRAAPLNDALENSSAWVLVYYSPKSVLFLRRDSESFRAVTTLVADKREWRPDTGEAMFCLGKVLLASPKPDFEGALAANKEAVKRSPGLARPQMASRAIYACYRQLRRFEEGIAYFEELKVLFEKPIQGMSDADRQNAALGLQNFVNALKQQVTPVPERK